MTPGIPTPEGVVFGVVSDGAPRAFVVAAIEAAGAMVETCAETDVLSKAGVVDALLFDVAGDPARFVVPAVALGTDPRTRWLPRIVIAPGDAQLEHVAAFGHALVLPAASAADTLAAAVAAVVEQVRERLAVDRQLRAEQEESNANEERLAALQQEGATLSHDARVLFGVIIGFASNLRDGIAGPVTELQRSHAVNIVEASTGASSLVDRHVASLRTVTRRAQRAATRALAPAVSARRRHHDLSEIVRPVVALFEGIAAAKQIRLTAVCERPVPCWCDTMQIKQALVNLISNALKFTPPGGAVEVEARFGPPASARGGGGERREVEIAVSDTGAGIPADQRERVFERGVRLERDKNSNGSGIGLAVVRDVVTLHGGVVKVEDGPGGGASFVLTFPADLRTRAGERTLPTPAPARVWPADDTTPVEIE